ncbi:phosphatidylinositol 3 and 4-kinase-domain-containing protein [Mycena maculata]|uniref:Phosphatidylinositol 4-kinase n=1 Tax=Mycena maculata TaxID=230809 RepID=A0AAD7MP16_9AGAR|nr:phosphatidylinositol 3 and 4-kinase-domain-containing protein [Mycena maculata]
MPSNSGYLPLSANADNEYDDEIPTASTSTAARHRGRSRRPRMGSIDLSSLDSAFKQWTLAIASKLKLQKKSKAGPSKIHIYRSVFEPMGVQMVDPNPIKTLDHKPPMTQAEFDSLVEGVRGAINEGIQPKMIIKGSSGSYFARAKNEMGRVHTVAVFKPKDEEPYGALNPKTTKWIHRQFRWIIPFGRACLIPNLSYISEAAASLLDSRLQLNIVPPTHLVSLSSPAFFYDWLDRNAAKKGKPLPEKIGSMQFFLSGYQDASEFLRKHPWPGRAIADTFDDSTHRQGGVSKRFLGALKIVCGRTGEAEEDIYDDADYEDEQNMFDATETGDPNRPFYWSQALQQSFREELEKLVILDYLMLNTDRGADNFMIKYCDGDHEKSLVDVAPSRSANLQMPSMSELRKPEGSPQIHVPPSTSMGPPTSTSSFTENYTRKPHMHIAAIDNSLSFPHEHPQGWRSYTYGWLYLPVSVIGRPFSEKTRNHFLPLLTSKEWWEETTFELLKMFSVDPDFHPKMFRRQLAVMKGQAWNIVQSLQHNDEGPLELTRRSKVLVWDDEVEIAEDAEERPHLSPRLSGDRLSISSVPLPRRTRSRSSGSDFPPPIHRTSTEASGVPRPVPFAAKFKRVHPGTKGIDVLEHLERLDAVEASLQRLGVEEFDEEEVDVGESSSAKPILVPTGTRSPSSGMAPSPFSPPSSPPLPTVPEVPSPTSSEEEEDVAMLSKSLTHVEGHHRRWASQAVREPEWISSGNAKRTVIVERLESVTKKPMCSCW